MRRDPAVYISSCSKSLKVVIRIRHPSISGVNTGQSAIDIVASGLHDSVGLYKRPRPDQVDTCLFWMRVFGIEQLRDRMFLTLSNGFKALNLHRWDICRCAFAKGRKEGVRVYQFLREPLISLYGEEFYEALCAAAANLLQE